MKLTQNKIWVIDLHFADARAKLIELNTALAVEKDATYHYEEGPAQKPRVDLVGIYVIGKLNGDKLTVHLHKFVPVDVLWFNIWANLNQGKKPTLGWVVLACDCGDVKLVPAKLKTPKKELLEVYPHD